MAPGWYAKRRRLSQYGMLVETLHASWRTALGEDEFRKPYFSALLKHLEEEKAVIYPSPERIFAWSHLTPFDDVRVVIIGQDPYHSEGLATGLAFSSKKVTPSLVNIFKAVAYSYPSSFAMPSHGCLERWARQGVLLLNTTLTVRAHEPGSHRTIRWEFFTDAVISTLVAASSAKSLSLVFMLWGNHAKTKKKLINDDHLVLTSTHPVAFTAHKDFIHCNHFRLANDHLEAQGLSPIDWTLPSRAEDTK